MFRAISPVGHPLSWAQIPSLFKNCPAEKGFLSAYYPPGSVFPVSSGTAALTVSLLIFKTVSEKKEVVLPAYSCPSLVAAIVTAGLKPVLCDLQQSTLVLDLKHLETVVGPNTLAVIAVHLFGVSENVSELKKMGSERGFFILEDAAQSFGNHCHALNKPYGTIGDLGVISFGRGKPLSLLHGGAVIVNHQGLIGNAQGLLATLPVPRGLGFLLPQTALLLLYSIFFHPRTHWIPRSMPFLKLGETHYIDGFPIEKIFPGVMNFGETVFRRFPEIRATRKSLTSAYMEALGNHSDHFSWGFDKESLDDTALIRFPILFREAALRDRVLSALERRGLGASGSFPVPLNELPGAAVHFCSNNSNHPNASAISQRLITLPLHEFVREREIAEIKTTVDNTINNAGF
jgi:dTDP-4-amino-4,6-dideoxygalactose transaminase